MPSQSRALEASFEPSDKSAVPPGSQPIPALEDFDSFFENLTNLDHVDWRSAHPANPECKAPAGAAATKPSAAKPAGKADPLAGLRSAVAQAKQAQRPATAQASGEEFPPAKRRGIPGAFRFAATALVLFIVGMGIGWAALSLPGRTASETEATLPAQAPGAVTASPAANGLAIEPKVTLPAKDASSDRTASIVPLTEAASGQASSDAIVLKPAGSGSAAPVAVAKSSSVVAVDLAAAKIASGTETPGLEGKTPDSSGKGAEIATSGKMPEASAKNPGSAATARKLALKPRPAKAAAVAAGPATPAAAEPAKESVEAASPAAGSARYAVQVGACRSARCVDNYRALVTPHLPANANTVRVIPVPADNSGLQRVRVAPLEKSEAQQLRTALVQADPRLSNAYVVEVHP